MVANDQEVIKVIENHPGFDVVIEALVEDTMNWRAITSRAEPDVGPGQVPQRRYLISDRSANTVSLVDNSANNTKSTIENFHQESTLAKQRASMFTPAIDKAFYDLMKLPFEAVKTIIANTWLRVRALAGFEEAEVKKSTGLKEILEPSKGTAGNPPPERGVSF
jgi:hypothetical protein